MGKLLLHPPKVLYKVDSAVRISDPDPVFLGHPDPDLDPVI